jgi:hypothetical protein
MNIQGKKKKTKGKLEPLPPKILEKKSGTEETKMFPTLFKQKGPFNNIIGNKISYSECMSYNTIEIQKSYKIN